jgi:hypothetical protein
MDVRDVECVNSIWVMRIQETFRPVKTAVSVRTIPLHSAVIQEGFLDYIASLPPGPLFPQIEKLDNYGTRSGPATSDMSEWMRGTVGINGGKTFYTHRHTVTTYLRSASADPTKPCTDDHERYLMAHGGGGVHADYGDYLIPDLKAAIECIPGL